MPSWFSPLFLSCKVFEQEAGNTFEDSKSYQNKLQVSEQIYTFIITQPLSFYVIRMKEELTIFDLPEQNTSLTIADHFLVSKEAQAIIGGVVGFWGGVFGMGSVYLLVVFLRRLRKNLHHHRQNIATFPTSKSDKSRIQTGYSAMFGHARADTSIDLMDIQSSQHSASAQSQHHASSVPEPPQATQPQIQPRMPKQSKMLHKTTSSAFGLGSQANSGGFAGTSGGTRLKFSGFGLGGSMRDDSGMADCQL